MAQMIPAWVDGRLQPVEKLEVHRRGLRHPAVSVFVLEGARTLLQRRAMEKYHTPGLWANACCTHPRWGERPLLVVQRRPGSGVTREDLLRFYDDKVVKWWVPDDVVFIDDMPLTATGKLFKLDLRERFKTHRLPG